MLLPRWGEFMLWVLMPRALPTADWFCHFRAQVGALRGDWECVKLGGWRIENDGTRGSEIVGPTERNQLKLKLRPFFNKFFY